MTKPNCHPANLEKLDSKNAYILDNGDYLYLYLGNQVSDTFIYNVLFLQLIIYIFRCLAMQTLAT